MPVFQGMERQDRLSEVDCATTSEIAYSVALVSAVAGFTTSLNTHTIRRMISILQTESGVTKNDVDYSLGHKLGTDVIKHCASRIDGCCSMNKKADIFQCATRAGLAIQSMKIAFEAQKIVETDLLDRFGAIAAAPEEDQARYKQAYRAGQAVDKRWHLY